MTSRQRAPQPLSPATPADDGVEHADGSLTCWGCGNRTPPPPDDAARSRLRHCPDCGAISRVGGRKRPPASNRGRGLNLKCLPWVVPLAFTLLLIGGITYVGVAHTLASVLAAARASAMTQAMHRFVIIPALLVGVVFNYTACVLVDPGVVPARPRPADGLPFCDAVPGGVDGWMWCTRCDPPRPRPPRSLHCSNCGACTRGHDHHCWFTGRCVGVRTHGYFIRFLVAILASCTYILAMLAWAMVGALYYDGVALVRTPSPQRGAMLLPAMFLVPLCIALMVAVGMLLNQQVVAACRNIPSLMLEPEDHAAVQRMGWRASVSRLQRLAGRGWWCLWWLPQPPRQAQPPHARAKSS